jgi:hypothetical protein
MISFNIINHLYKREIILWCIVKDKWSAVLNYRPPLPVGMKFSRKISFWYHAIPEYINSRESLIVSLILVFTIPFLFSSNVPGNFTESPSIMLYHWFSIPAPEVSIANFHVPAKGIVSLTGSNGLSSHDSKISIRSAIRGKRFRNIF